MKIIDLLNKIANGETFKKLEYDEEVYIYNEINRNYYDEGENYWLFDDGICSILNEEVEIIEEDKKIEKIKWKSNVENLKQVNTNTNEMIDKINEIIDEVNKLKDDRK